MGWVCIVSTCACLFKRCLRNSWPKEIMARELERKGTWLSLTPESPVFDYLWLQVLFFEREIFSGRRQTKERARGGWRDCVLPDPFSPLSQASRLSICEKAKIGILKSIWLIWTQPRFHWGMVYINVGWMTGVGLMAGCRFAGKQADYRPEALAEACCGSTTPICSRLDGSPDTCALAHFSCLLGASSGLL